MPLDLPPSFHSPRPVEDSAFEGFGKSLVNAAIQNPLNSLSQIGSAVTGVNLPELHYFDPAEPTNGTEKFAQQAGGVLGMMVPFLIARKTVGWTGAKLGLESSGSLLSVAGEQAATGAVMGLALTPSNEGLYGRLKNAAVDAGTFAVMGTASAKLTASYGVGELPLASRMLRSSLIGIGSGIPGGITNAELSSVVNNGQFASLSDLRDDAASFALFGGILGGVGELHSTRPGAKPNQTMPLGAREPLGIRTGADAARPEPAPENTRPEPAPENRSLISGERLDVSDRSVDAGSQARVRGEWVPLSAEEIARSAKLAEQDASQMRSWNGESVHDVISGALDNGILANPARVKMTDALVREHFASLRGADGIIADQASNWVHTMQEGARLVRYAEIARDLAAKASGETAPAKLKAAADAAMPAEDATLAYVGSAFSDSTKSQPAKYEFLKLDGTTETRDLPGNFVTHPQDAIHALDANREALGLSQPEFDIVKHAILAHQSTAGPVETIMGLLYNFDIGAKLGAIDTAVKAGEMEKVPKWIQDGLKEDSNFVTNLPDIYNRELRTMRDPAAEAVDPGNGPQDNPSKMKVIGFISDARYAMAPPSEVPVGVKAPTVKITPDGKGWEVELTADQHKLLKVAGLERWEVAHKPTPDELAKMTPDQADYFQRLARVSYALSAADAGQYGAKAIGADGQLRQGVGLEAAYKYMGVLRGPGSGFPVPDALASDALKSVQASSTDARWGLDEAGRILQKEVARETGPQFDLANGPFKQRTDLALMRELKIQLDGKNADQLGEVLQRSHIYDNGYPAVQPGQEANFARLRDALKSEQTPTDRTRDLAEMERITGQSQAQVEDYIFASRIMDRINQIAWWGRKLTPDDYKDKTPAFQEGEVTRKVIARTARAQASMYPANFSDDFQSVRWLRRAGGDQ